MNTINKETEKLSVRVETGAIICIATCVLLLFSGVDWFLNTVVAFLCLQAIFELYRATGAKNNRILYGISCMIAAILSYISIPYYEIVTGILFAVAVVFFLYLMLNIKRIQSIHPAVSALTACLIVCFYKAMSYIRSEKFGFYIFALSLLICNVDDIAAYFVGRGCGKHKLAPVISSNKTVEGSIGGVACSVAFFLLFGFILDKAGVVSVCYERLTVYLILASLIGQFGDLAMSSIKRITKIKDYGTLLPGHGGILDRFDSLLFVLPFTYLFCLWQGPIFF